MKYGLIGERLGHSFSKDIHAHLASYEYELCEVCREDFDSFARRRDFNAINVTMPYKCDFLPYLYHIDDTAREIGAVNVVVNREGLLYGYNTDFYGMRALINKMGVNPEGKKCAILGTGGTSKTARAVLASFGAGEILTVSRSVKDGCITYEELYEKHSDVELIVNTTPLGMFPSNDGIAVDLARLPRVAAVADAVYNPLSTRLVLEAREKKIKAEGGLYMLVAQAVRASEIFIDTVYGQEVLDGVFEKIKASKENVVLTGMPASGKSTVGRLVAEALGREFCDTDTLIEEKTGMKIPDIFEKKGEAYFRDIECEVIKETAKKTSLVIATGGGAILRGENVSALKQNGRIYFLNRDISLLTPTADRPLSSSREAIEKRYRERYPIYKSSADREIEANGTASEVAEKIIGDFRK